MHSDDISCRNNYEGGNSMKVMIMKVIRSLVMFGLNWLYNYTDQDKDGKITKKEIIKLFDKIKELK